MGSSSRTDETILSWSLVRRPIPLRINILETMAIRFALKKAIRYIHILVSWFYRQHNSSLLYLQTRRNTSPNLCVEVCEILHWCLGHDVVITVLHIPGKFSILADRLSRMNKPLKTEWALDQSIAKHFSNAHLPQCGSVCDTLQSQTPTVCISSSGQSCLGDRRIINELESSSCICISSNSSDISRGSQRYYNC